MYAVFERSLLLRFLTPRRRAGASVECTNAGVRRDRALLKAPEPPLVGVGVPGSLTRASGVYEFGHRIQFCRKRTHGRCRPYLFACEIRNDEGLNKSRELRNENSR